jgi:hypothetical protein
LFFFGSFTHPFHSTSFGFLFGQFIIITIEEVNEVITLFTLDYYYFYRIDAPKKARASRQQCIQPRRSYVESKLIREAETQQQVSKLIHFC